MAAELSVNPEHLEELAEEQTEAAKSAGEAASAANGTGQSCWITHGVISGSSNGAFTTVGEARYAAGKSIAQASSDLAAKLLTASQTYTGVDADISGNLNQQVLPR